MDDGYVFKTQSFGGFKDELPEAGGIRNVEPADITVTRIEAVADRYVDIRACELSNRGELVELAAELGSRASRVFKQDSELGMMREAGVEGMPGEGQRFGGI